MTTLGPFARTGLASLVLASGAAIGTEPALAGASAYDLDVLLRRPSQAAPAAARPVSPAPAPAPTVAPPPAPSAPPPPAAAPSPPAEDLSVYEAARDRWYVSGGVGLVLPRDADNRGQIDIVTESGNGLSLSHALGYAWRSGFRVEGNVWYQTYPVDTLNVKEAGNIAGLSTGTTSAGGDITALTITGNVGYDIDTGTPFVPYVIGGAGLVRYSMDNVNSQGVTVFDDSTWQLAFQFGVGGLYQITNRWSAGVGYRFLFSLTPSLRDAADDKFDSEYVTHNFLFDARYAF